MEWKTSARSAADWKEVFQALGFTVEHLGRKHGVYRAVLSRTLPAQKARRFSVILPREGEKTGFDRLFEWIGFFQRFDAILNAEITLVEDVPLGGNEEMLRNLEREGFFQRKTHFRPAGFLQCLRTGVLFSTGQLIIIDGSEGVPVTEVQTLLEAAYPLDATEEFFSVRSLPVNMNTDLRRKLQTRKELWSARLRAFPENLRFSLHSAEAARRILHSRFSRFLSLAPMPSASAVVMRR